MSVMFSEGSAARDTQDHEMFQQANDNANGLRLVVDRERWSALESLPSPVVVIDANGAIHAANQAWQTHTATMGARVINGAVGTGYIATGRQVLNFSRETATAVTDGLRAVLAGERSVFDHEHACHPPEAEQWLHLTITPCSIQGQRGAMVHHHDITERRQAERRRQFATVVARAVEREAPRREMIRDVIAATCDLLGWEMAATWSFDKNSRVLRCDNVHPQRTSSARGWSATVNQHGLAARAWASNTSVLFSDGIERDDAQVARSVLGSGASQLIEACAMLVGTAERPEGVVVFYSTHRHRPDETFLRTLSCLFLGSTWTRPEPVVVEQRVSGPPEEGVREMLEAPAAPEKAKAPTLDTLIGLASMSAATVLLRGGSGVGKSRVAREIHLRSERARGPFVDLNCAMLTPSALEDDLFGHEVGAFPGAERPHRGVLEEATGGTILLDEVGCLDASMQLKLSKLLETRSYRHLGGNRDLRADVRFIATSSRDLRAAVRAGTFREDLFYRLNVIEVALPPLRARQSEITDIARRMLDEVARAYSRPAPKLTPEAERALVAHTWPGNLREMRTVLERSWLGVGPEISGAAVVASIASLHEAAANDVDTVQPIHVPAMPAPSANVSPEASAAVMAALVVPPMMPVTPVDPTSSLLAAQERAHIERVLAQTGYNMRRAAQMLGISRSTLYLRAKDYHLDIGTARRIGRSGRRAANSTTAPKGEPSAE